MQRIDPPGLKPAKVVSLAWKVFYETDAHQISIKRKDKKYKIAFVDITALITSTSRGANE
jgi:hypothetical protein